ncbi:hypothetical protein [Levilactobacillus suantsaii]|uniref:Uncharacterized protein n=1 Tax=Levilactobacillus suantsaii TaxID=2292255 RepID=A0A4Q0VIU8_9LACO|nr:hypothetical protein [Levilactobacillus suantsaii]QMU07342.1 hypothetical protein H3M12_07625 [Levilactobacillus suantsaii]RXI76792.1 hypothetical protein DXH47_09880 [Levilactobacillus suantsaii]
MKTTKLVMGILMILLSVFILVQSSIVGIGDALAAGNHSSGSAGLMVAVFYLASGIVYLATRKSVRLSGDIATCIMLILAWIIGLADVGFYADLIVWSWLALIIGVGFLLWHLRVNQKARRQGSDHTA